jgi:hypothetical protein
MLAADNLALQVPVLQSLLMITVTLARPVAPRSALLSSSAASSVINNAA